MNHSQYQRLGDFIEPHCEKNVGLSVKLSQGINNNKYFQNPRQVAQNSENDQIVRKGQFAFNKATTRNGDKISIAYRDDEDCTVSSAYQVFSITDEEKLHPYYLLLWFKRPEFDRYARFKSHGSAHEFFTWEEMCNVMLPVPPITEQRRIVNEYQTVERRIANNEALIQKLEETAQAIYRHTFVEGIDVENLPEGWKMGTLTDVATFKVGGDRPFIFSENQTEDCQIPIYSNGVEAEGLYGFTNKAVVSKCSVTISARGNVGTCFLRRHPYTGIVRLISVIPKNEDFIYYLLFDLSSRNMTGDGSAQSQITIPQLQNEKIIIPGNDIMHIFYTKVNCIYDYIDIVKEETHHLRTLLTLLTSKLS